VSQLGAEREAVQNPLIRYATEVGWQYVDPEEAVRLRQGETGLVFRQLFIEQMQRLNPDFMGPVLAEELIKALERIAPNVEGNLVAWEYLKGLRSVFVPDENRERNVRFIDAADLGRNVFQVTDEFTFSNGAHTIRGDVVFLINGVPVLIIETKASHKVDGIAEALDQMRRYHREAPEFLALLQLYALTHIIRFLYSATWSWSKQTLFDWREETAGSFEDLVRSFLDSARVVRVLTDFVLFTRKDEELRKVVLRPHQIRAVDRVVERAADAEKRHGLVWHTQGSGKTYTMIVAAQHILSNPLFQNPTVIMLVDRNELEAQLFGNLRAVGFEHVVVTESKRHLQELLAGDQRGLIVSMIHKFERMPANINTRDNIFVLVDEAHRTTGGKMGNYLMGALPNATYIGFTGTPIDKTSHGQSTFVTFGIDDPPAGYLDKYSIRESIQDGTTVPLHYSLAPNELQVDRETLEREFLDLAEAQGVSDVEELNRVLEKAVTLRNMLKNPERVARVAEYVARHFREVVEPLGYKAFLVAVDREACAMYKKALDEHLPPEYSTVVYSPHHNDRPEMAQYHLSAEQEKRVRRDFRAPDKLPKILIVTEKLLTGFDAPVLYCMYLDKPMRDHVLLQAIARVNRPYEDESERHKPAGFVLDFVGIFGDLKNALAFDSADIEGVVHDVQVLRDRFAEMMDEAQGRYLPLVEDKRRDKAVEVVLEHFRDEEVRHQFYRFFRELEDIYDILSPDQFLRPYMDDFETLTRMYRIVREAYEPGALVDKEFSRKTAELVRQHTKSGQIKPAVEVFEINEGTLRKLEESEASDTEKIFSLAKSILEEVQARAECEPYLISIGERAEAIVEYYKQRQKSTQATLEALKELVREINEARRRQAEINMPPDVFAVYWLLKREGVPEAEATADEMSKVLAQYPHWRTSRRHEREVRHGLTKHLVRSGITDPGRIKEITDTIVRALRGAT